MIKSGDLSIPIFKKCCLEPQVQAILTALVISVPSTEIFAQTALYNAGNLRIHSEGRLGFHTNFINDSPFYKNTGLAGFYGDNTLKISGTYTPVFHDLELLNPAGVELRTAIEVSNNTNFILGDFRTPIDREDIYMNFIGEAYYTGATNSSKINGLASVAAQVEFVFPVGDEVQTRPLILHSEKVNVLAKCRYFLKNPDTSFTPWPLSSVRKSPLIAIVSNLEFWQLQGSVLSTITVSWNIRSNIAELTVEPDKITLAGWNKTEARWVPLGRESLNGDLASGNISSIPFIPDEYGAITFASLDRSPIQPALHNYFLSPNGDGINDFLVFPELEQKGKITLKIYDRYGLKVFEKKNYTNEFEGRARGAKFIISPKNELPEGIYYYLLRQHDPGLIYQGFLYLER